MEEKDVEKVDPFWGNLFKGLLSSENEAETDLLARIPIFKELSKRELRTVGGVLYDRNYEAGENIFKMHQPGAAMFIIKKGRVQIVLDEDDENPTVLAELNEGNFFGEIALLENSPRSASAYAVTNTELLAVFRSDIEHLMQREPYIAARIMKQLAVVIGIRLKETNKLLSKSSAEDNE